MNKCYNKVFINWKICQHTDENSQILFVFLPSLHAPFLSQYASILSAALHVV